MTSRATRRKGVTTELMARADEVVFGRFRVEVIKGPDLGASHVAGAPELGVGTAPTNQLVLTDRSVSRHHCEITVTPRGYLLRDLDSTNGTTVSGVRVEAAYLQSGATIDVGDTRLRFEALTDTIREPLADEEHLGSMLGQSTEMRRLFAVLPKIAASSTTVLLEGETGSGKGLLAELIHQQSPRAARPFVVIDCGAIPPSLIEAELFGHEKGAFTDAQAARAGAFEAARGGTVLLDEIGELRLDLQPKLLRALEERMIRRIGSVLPVRLDVRLIAATNRDLRQEVNRGTFRSDLFYRLNVVRLHLPPLRDRPEDIPLLAAHFYRQFTDGGEPPAELVEALLRHDWPGNVRELRSAVERAVLLGDPSLWREGRRGARPASHGDAGDDDLDPAEASLPFREGKEQVIARWERAYLRALIRSNEGNLSRAARAARMDRNHLRELLRRHGISAADT
ncbi:ATPase AAA [Sorangium cellulosum]|uniref:ATPase AAA n=1 Tax=Sorangium cellulosum TaxID=56 RepID=A0A2L0EW06_SORCE|nr:sigma 54-interacting transcriptional regulator [Sorangium cellulosum]AUX43490.1 ATPase AAA [Sorangium cellulosum]